MGLTTDEEFAAFVEARYRALVRTGLLLTGDTGHAEDLTQAALIRTYLAWSRLRQQENAEAYARRTLVRLAMRARRRRWTSEVAVEPILQRSSATAIATETDDLAIDVRAGPGSASMHANARTAWDASARRSRWPLARLRRTDSDTALLWCMKQRSVC